MWSDLPCSFHVLFFVFWLKRPKNENISFPLYLFSVLKPFLFIFTGRRHDLSDWYAPTWWVNMVAWKTRFRGRFLSLWVCRGHWWQSAPGPQPTHGGHNETEKKFNGFWGMKTIKFIRYFLSEKNCLNDDVTFLRSDLSGSFHFSFFVFWSKWPKTKISAVLLVETEKNSIGSEVWKLSFLWSILRQKIFCLNENVTLLLSYFFWKGLWIFLDYNQSDHRYGSTGCWVFMRGVQNEKDGCLRINMCTQRKSLNFEYWCSGELSKIGHYFSNKVI